MFGVGIGGSYSIGELRLIHALRIWISEIELKERHTQQQITGDYLSLSLSIYIYIYIGIEGYTQ